MGLFVTVKLDAAAAGERARRLPEICPVGIFEARDGAVVVVGENEDECTLCDLCLRECPGAVEIVKEYERR